MKYEFHVGDYVETVGGFVGWISAIRDNDYIIIADKNNNYRKKVTILTASESTILQSLKSRKKLRS